MLGLRTEENNEFLKFFEIVQSEAEKNKSIFFLECGEGREFTEDEIEGEDLRGWLIPKNQHEEFLKEYSEENITDKWKNFICWAIWNKKNDLYNVEFKNFSVE